MENEIKDLPNVIDESNYKDVLKHLSFILQQIKDTRDNVMLKKLYKTLDNKYQAMLEQTYQNWLGNSPYVDQEFLKETDIQHEFNLMDEVIKKVNTNK